MIAIATISRVVPEILYPQIEFIEKTMDKGSVITRDAGIWALSDIAAADTFYGEAILPYLLNHLSTCRPKDVPQHAERVVNAVASEHHWQASCRLSKSGWKICLPPNKNGSKQ